MFTHHSLTLGRIPGRAPTGKPGVLVNLPPLSMTVQSASALARSNSFISFLTTSLIKALSPLPPYTSISSPYPLFSLLSNSINQSIGLTCKPSPGRTTLMHEVMQFHMSDQTTSACLFSEHYNLRMCPSCQLNLLY